MSGLQRVVPQGRGPGTKPCYQTFVDQTAGCEKLYRKVPQSGDLILVNVNPHLVNNKILGNEEIKATVEGLYKGHASKASDLCAKYIKLWPHRVEEEAEDGPAGAGGKW